MAGHVGARVGRLAAATGKRTARALPRLSAGLDARQLLRGELGGVNEGFVDRGALELRHLPHSAARAGEEGRGKGGGERRRL